VRNVPADEPATALERWRKRTVTGAILTRVALGLREALEAPYDERPAIVIDAAGDPPGPQPFELDLVEDHPERARVIVRPWLLP
jgi:hypothetical protein